MNSTYSLIKVKAEGNGTNHLLMKSGVTMHNGTFTIDVPDLAPENALEWGLHYYDLFYQWGGQMKSPALGYGYYHRE